MNHSSTHHRSHRPRWAHGKSRALRGVLAGTLLVLPMLATAAVASTGTVPSLPQLSRQLEQHQPACVSFEQNRWMADLQTELPSAGYFRRQPSGLVWQTLSPIEDRVVLSADNPELPPGLKALLPVLTGLFDGNWASLEGHFSVRLGGNLDDWQAQLAPLDRAIAERLQGIELDGAEQVEHLQVSFTDGDRLRLELSPLPCDALTGAPGA